MRILVVEDDLQIQKFLKSSLESECFAVDASSDGKEGLKLGLVNDYDFAILDNQLPNISGLEICRELRAAQKMLPILILSVTSDTTTKVNALDVGADDYLTKPFSLRELLARVHALLRRPHQITSTVYEAYDITLDTKSHRVTKENKEIPLTRKEFMLLEYLMRCRGTVVSRGMLIEHVWDMNADPFSNTIESHILSLRKKLDLNKNKNVIKTVSGYGYKFE